MVTPLIADAMPQGKSKEENAVGAYEYPLIIKQLLITPLSQCPNQEIVYRDQKRFTYREFGERLHRLGSALANLGVKHGETVAVMDWDTNRYLECFWAVPMAGAVLQTVNVRLSAEQIVYTLNHARADVIFCNTEFAALLQAIQPMLTTVRKFVCLTDDGTIPAAVKWDGEYEALLAEGDPKHVFEDFDENTRATTFYTTGTTGNPKGVYYSHRQLVLHTMNGLGMLPFADTDVYMPLTPMFHVHAWGNPYNATVRGLKQVYPGRYQPEMLVKLFVTEKVTFSHCVPTILQMFLAGAKDVDLNGWKLIIGGSALPRALAQAALDRGIDIFAGYGMSETGPMATVAIVPTHLRDGGETELTYRTRAGRPCAMVDIRILDQNGRELPHDGHSAGRNRHTLSLADARLPARRGRQCRFVGRRLDAHRRHRHDRRARVSQHHRPHQGRCEDGRRMGFQHSARGHPARASVCRGSRRHRGARYPMGRTAGCRRGYQAGARR